MDPEIAHGQVNHSERWQCCIETKKMKCILTKKNEKAI